MTAAIIALREFQERGRLFAICALLAVMPFLATLLPGVRNQRADVIGAVSSFLALAIALGSAAAFGGSTVMRDMAERRLSFYFSRPISPAALWVGKAAASILSSYVCFAIIALPSALAIRSAWPGLWLLTTRQIVLLTGAGVILLFLLFHALSSVIRSRSVLIAIDFVLLAVTAAAAVSIARPLMIGAAIDLVRILGITFGAAVLLVLTVAPVWQLAKGRTDIRRSHAALSKFLWPSILGVLAIIGGYVAWVVHPKPSDLSRLVQLRQSPGAEWFLAAGSTRGRGDYHAAFLVDRKGGWRRIAMAPWSEMQFSRDGKVAAWFEPAGWITLNEFEIRTTRNNAGIRVNGIRPMVLSDDGSRVAVGLGEIVTVFDVATGKILASAGGFDRTLGHQMFFVSKDLVRVIELTYRATGGPFRIFEIDIPRKKVMKTGELSLPVGAMFTASHDGSRILLRRLRRVIDGRTAQTLQQLPMHDTHSAALLSDGRVVETVREGKQSRLRVHGGREIVLPIEYAAIAGELDPGKVIVRGVKYMGWAYTGKDRVQYVVDVDRGVIDRAIPNVKSPDWGWGTDLRMIRYDALRLVGVDREGKLVWWDPRTGVVERTDV
jgi:hypothetical protein